MSEVKRWDIDQYEGEWATMGEDTRGDYVLASDYDQLKAELDRLRDVQILLNTERALVEQLEERLDEARELLKEVRSPEPIGPMCIWKRIDAWLERNK